MRQAWHIVEPARPFLDVWHLRVICEHLEAVTSGEIRKLLINIPPGHAKSLAVSVFWPCWEWTRCPERRWLYSSYALSLSVRDSIKCRRIIESPWYRERWDHVFRLRDDQNAKLKFENDKTGYRLSTSVGGAVTGERGDRVVVDDPHNMLDVESDVKRQDVLTWWDEAMSTRLNDYKTGAHVIVMQRLHAEDLAGHVLEQGGYEHLCLPTEYDPATTKTTAIGFRDPRMTEGELLCPALFGVEQNADAKTRLGPYGYAGQHGQSPSPRSGGMLPIGKMGIVDAVPANARRVRYWDKAGTAGGGAYSAGVKVARGDDGIYYIEDVVRGQWGAEARNAVMLQTAQTDDRTVSVWQEQEPGSGGKESAEATVRLLAGFDVHTERVTGEKVVRATPFAAQVQAGNVRLVRGEWNRAFLDEAKDFPASKYKDQIDAAAGAFNKLATGNQPYSWLINDPAFRAEVLGSDAGDGTPPPDRPAPDPLNPTHRVTPVATGLGGATPDDEEARLEKRRAALLATYITAD